MTIRDRLARLEKLAGPTARPAPLVVVCRRIGDDDEDRAPGVYYDSPGSLAPTVVFTGDEPDPKVLAKFTPERGPSPLVIVCGPREVLPPEEMPR